MMGNVGQTCRFTLSRARRGEGSAPFHFASVALFSAILLLTGTAAAQTQPAPPATPADFSSITNFLRVNDQICTGGQPTLEDLAKMKAEGIRAIVNLRRASEHNFAEEAARAQELGLRYVHIPVDGSNPQDSQAAEFLRATSDPENRPAFIH